MADFAFDEEKAAAGEAPSAADAAAMAAAGLFPCDADVRDEGGVPFAGEWFWVERADAGDPEDAGRMRARAFCYFEPKSVGGAEANWNCCIEMEGDFVSRNGTWPDCFSDAAGAARCIEGYFGEGGLLAERGWKAAGR